ncbi:MAG: hypothetical protein LM589_05950 [Thermosphaera sp.]|nr:hypothetical protein [Thermosphaera sp.]
MFANYAAIVKNLRGVVLFDLGEEGSWDTVKWLVNRFKYCNLGITPIIHSRYKDKLEKYMGGKPFRLLTHPLQELELFTGEFSNSLGVDPELGELLAFSSMYISPAMVIGKRYENDLSKLSVENIKTCRELSLNDWKLHMRIADYTVLDMYEYSIKTALRAIEKCSSSELGKVLDERLELIRKDVKRYWRIACNGGDGRVFLYYVDNLKLYVEKQSIRSLRGRSNVAPALAIIPVISIPTKMK